MGEQADDGNLRRAHGGLLLATLALPLFIPELAHWPWLFLAPLLLYGLLVCVIGPLRRSVHWFAVGRLDWAVLGAVTLISLLTSSVLVIFSVYGQPDLVLLRNELPLSALPLLVGCAVFALLNALMEELVFRGIMMDALEASVGPVVALVAQGIAFGAVHARGFPSGIAGVILASIYGFILGGMRQWTRGLAAAYICHVFADVTIFVIVVRSAG